MSVAWVADPDAKRTCGHARCRRTVRAGVALMAVSAGVIFGGAALFPGHAAAVVAAAFAAFAAGVVLACWPHPRGGGALEALIEATRECGRCLRGRGPCTCTQRCDSALCLNGATAGTAPAGATRETAPRLPRRWTGRDWAELERELSR